MIELLITNILDSFPILNKLKSNFSGHSKHILIVPDRFTLSYEKAALEVLEIYGSFDIEVVSFSRLADKILQDKSNKMLNKQTEVMLLRKVIDECKDKLLCYKNVSNCVGFASEMYAVISEIRNSGVSTETLQNILPLLPQKIANKTRDIVTIYYEYATALQKNYTDGTSKLQMLADYIQNSDIAESNVYISDFLSLTNVESNIVEQLMLHCLSTTICIVDNNGANAEVYPKELLHTIEKISRKNGLTLHTSRCDIPLKKDFDAISKELFGYSKTVPSNGGQVSFLRANSVNEEVRSVAEKIVKLVKKDGYRYKDIAVVCCDFAQYSEILEKIFLVYDIPYFFDKKQPLFKQCISKLLFSAINVVVNGFRRENVMELAKNSLLELEYENVCVFENYCLKYGIDFNRFFLPFQFGETLEKEKAEEIRRNILHITNPLCDKMETTADIVRGIKKIFAQLNIEKKIQNLSKKQEEHKLGMQAALTNQSLSGVVALLDEANAILGASKMTLKDFANIISSAIFGVEISNIPLNIDEVFVGEGQESRYEKIKFMFVLGVSGGVFPTESCDNGIITERESSCWAGCGVNVQPNIFARNKMERLGVLMLLLKPKEHLQISYSSTNLLGEELHIGATMEYLQEICGAPLERISRNFANSNLEEYIQSCASEKNALTELLFLREKINNREILPTDKILQLMDCLYFFATHQKGNYYVDKLLEENYFLPDSLQGKYNSVWKNGATSPSQLEKYFTCPFCHFMDYILRVKERDESKLEMSDLGTILHAIAEKYFGQPDCCDIDKEETTARIQDIFCEYCSSDIKMQTLLAKPNGENLKRVILKRSTDFIVNLVKKMQVTAFRPYKLEMSFGMGKGYRAVNIKARDKEIKIHGIIDRIDKFEDKALIVDYKSKSQIDFSPSAIIYGERSQMFIYLAALLENECLTPSGVFYMLMSSKIYKNDAKSDKYSYIGYVANEGVDFSAFDKNFKNDEDFKSELFPIVKKTTKKVQKVEGNILSVSQLKEAEKYVQKMLVEAIDNICDGWIAVSPLSTDIKVSKSCEYCKYSELCKIDCRLGNVRSKQKYSIDEMIDIVEDKNANLE